MSEQDQNKVSLLEAVVEIAMEMELTDPTDFGYLKISEETAYRMMANHLVEQALQTPAGAARELALLATSTHLLVENFVLQQKILNQRAEK